MEFTLKDTTILDTDIIDKLEPLLRTERMEIDEKKYYNLTVSFPECFLASDKMQNYVNSYRESEKYDDQFQEIISSLLNEILQSIKVSVSNIINIDDSKFYHNSIEGRTLESGTIIKIKIEETIPTYYGKGKNKSAMRVNSIIPSVLCINKGLNKAISEQIKNKYLKFYSLVGYKVMSRFLNITETNDMNKLYSEFVQQFGREYQKSFLLLENSFDKMIDESFRRMIEKYEKNKT